VYAPLVKDIRRHRGSMENNLSLTAKAGNTLTTINVVILSTYVAPVEYGYIFRCNTGALQEDCSIKVGSS
jgi:hypothetical protein